MKKLMTLLTALSLIFALSACGGAAPAGGQKDADAGAEDAGTADAGAEDAGTVDAGAEDAGTADAGAEDASEDAGAVDISAEADAAYQTKLDAARQDMEEGAELFSAVIPCGTGEPVLVVAMETYGPEGTREAMEAEVYQYADGEVKQLTSVSSTGTAYPLAYTDEAVLFGGNHTAGKLVIHGGTAELYRLVNMNIEGRTAVLEEYSVSGGVEILESSQEIAPEDETAYDFYLNGFADDTARIIEFS